MIDRSTALMLVDHVAELHHARVSSPDDALPQTARTALRILGVAVPGAKALVEELIARADRVSVTIPAPGDTLIVLAPPALETPEDYASTGLHEGHHAHQIEKLGDYQAAVDYLFSTELKGAREGQAFAVGLGMRWILTGEVPTPEGAMRSLASDTYHLPPGDLELARGVVTSAVETMREGICPPYQVLLEALAWLRANAPEAIAVEVLRPTVVP